MLYDLHKITLPIILLLVGNFLLKNSAYSQDFNILNYGELDLDSDQITTEGKVKKYFGMNVEGLGDSRIRIIIGNASAETTYPFEIFSTQLYSYLFSYDLAEEISVPFRRGVFGDIVIEILNSAGVSQESVTLTLDVKLPKSNCKKHPSDKLKKCSRLNLARASKTQRRKLARVFANSIRGPIVLVPKKKGLSSPFHTRY